MTSGKTKDRVIQNRERVDTKGVFVGVQTTEKAFSQYNPHQEISVNYHVDNK
jgi:hypothetical protein